MMATFTGLGIESVSPISGSEGISALVLIKVKFSEVMSASTLTEDTIYLRPFGDTTQKIPCTIELEAGDSHVVVLDPVAQLADNTEYEIVVVGQNTGSTVKDIFDNPLLLTHTSSFTTAEATPAPPPPVDPQDDGSGEPTVNPYVVSSYPRDGAFNVSPASIKLKFNQDISALTLTLGTGSTPGDFNLIEGEFLEKDLEDINILPVVCVDGTHTVSGMILEFTPTEALKNDTVYTIVMTGSKTESYVAGFQSKYTDFYGDIKLIQSDISKYIKISDDLLARYVAASSKEARTTAEQYYNDDNDNAIDWTDPPLFIDEYVRYKTNYELVNTKYIELTTSSSMVQLGDFTVQNTVSAQGLATFRDGLRLQMKRWEDELHGQHNRGYAKPVAVGKRTSSTAGDGYPDFMDRGLKDTDGTKSYD
jgi:hypothetical protein